MGMANTKTGDDTCSDHLLGLSSHNSGLRLPSNGRGRVRIPKPTKGGPVSSGPTQRDVELRAAIDEARQAAENLRRAREEGQRWQQENPPPQQPQSVRSMAEVEEFGRSKEEWSKPNTERSERLDQAKSQLLTATNKVTSLLPEDIAYEYKGKLYKRKGSSYDVKDIG